MKESPDKDDQFGKAEAKRRFDQALRGARIAGHKPMKDVLSKGPKAKRKKEVRKGKSKPAS